MVSAVISVLKFLFDFRRTRPKLRVEPLWRARYNRDTGERIDGLCIEVTNLGTIAVTVKEVGFRIRGSKEVWTLFDPDNCRLPYRLEPRASFAPAANVNMFDYQRLLSCRKAFATTQCGITFTANIKKLVSDANSRIAAAKQT